jgi:hypothetical protein
VQLNVTRIYDGAVLPVLPGIELDYGTYQERQHT